MTKPVRTVALLPCLLALALTTSPALAEGPPSEVRMSLERYEALMKQAQRTDGPRATWSRGDVRVTLPGEDGRFATVAVRATARVVGTGLAEVPLLPADVVLEEAIVGGSNATLLRRGGIQMAVFEPGTRTAEVRLRYLVPARTSAEGALVAMVPLPPMPSSSFAVDGSAADGPVDVWPGTGDSAGGTSVSGALPATLAMVVRWGAGAAGHAVRKADYRLKPDASGDGVDVEATFDVNVTGARAVVRVASSEVALMSVTDGNAPVEARVSGEWQQVVLTGKGRHTLKVVFRQTIDRSQGQPKVALRLSGSPITQVTTTIPGTRAVTIDPVVPVETTVTGEGDAATTTAVAHLPPTDEVTLQWTEKRAKPEEDKKINVETFQLISVEEGVIRSKVHLRYDVIRGKAKEMAIAIPEGVVLFKVTGPQIEKWPIYPANDEAPRQARIILGREREGTYELVLELQMSVAKGVEQVQLPIVRPLDVYHQTGVVALFDGDKVGFEAPAQASDAFIKAGENDLPVDIRQQLTDKVSQAFRHTGAPGSIASKLIETKVREVRFDARVHTLYRVKEGVLVGNSSILVEIKSGRRDHLYVSLPTDKVRPLSWNAPSLAKDPAAADKPAEGIPEGRTAYEIRFTQALEGAIQIDVEFEMLLDKELGTMALPAASVHGADVEEGAFGLVADTGIEITPGEAKDLRRVDNDELPKAVRLRSDREILLGYTYARAPWSLTLSIKRHQVIETLKAIASQVWLDTTVFEDGHIKTAATFEIRNEHQQYLRLKMPEPHKVLKVFADQRPVKANRDEGALTIPLPKEQTVIVTVIYEVVRDTDEDGQPDSLEFFGNLELVAPRADMRMSDIQWLVRTPRELAIWGADTELHEGRPDEYRPPTDLAPQVGVLTSLPNEDEYARRLFTVEERRAEQDAIAITMAYASTPGSWTGVLLSLLALLLLGLVVRRRVSQEPLGVGGVLMLLLGLGAVVFKAAGWGFGVGEGITGVVVLLVVALISWRGRPHVGEAE